LLTSFVRCPLSKSYEVISKTNLLYRVVVSPNGDYSPPSPLNVKRGQNAFQVDLLIGKRKGEFLLPLVAMEVKYKRISTHSVITYSGKAVRHKEIYPYLRYGMIIGGVDSIPNRFFVHNIGMDFALAVKEVSDENLLEIVKKQIKIAEKLVKVVGKEKRIRGFESRIRLK